MKWKKAWLSPCPGVGFKAVYRDFTWYTEILYRDLDDKIRKEFSLFGLKSHYLIPRS